MVAAGRAEMQSPLMSPIVASSSLEGIGITSKSRSGAPRSSGTIDRKPAIIPSWPRLNQSMAEASESSSSVRVSAGSRSSSRVGVRASRVSSEENSSDVGSVSELKTSPPPA
jgi:hypothetical protein